VSAKPRVETHVERCRLLAKLAKKATTREQLATVAEARILLREAQACESEIAVKRRELLALLRDGLVAGSPEIEALVLDAVHAFLEPLAIQPREEAALLGEALSP